MNQVYIGQRVRIRDWDELVAEYGTTKDGAVKSPAEYFFDIPKSERNLSGKYASVSEVDNYFDAATLDFDNIDGYDDVHIYIETFALEPILQKLDHAIMERCKLYGQDDATSYASVYRVICVRMGVDYIHEDEEEAAIALLDEILPEVMADS